MTSVYRHFDADGQLLYIGCSINPLQRLESHKQQSDWFDSIATVTIENYRTHSEALAIEASAILGEQPLYNKVHKKKRKVRTSKIEAKPAYVPTEKDIESMRQALVWGYIHRALSIPELRKFARSDRTEWLKENAELYKMAETFAAQFKGNYFKGFDALSFCDNETAQGSADG